MSLSENQVLALAPDASSAKAGRSLAQAGKWASLSVSASVIWGECRGSAAQPYRVQADLQSLAFKCSCPSRKLPCKHLLALLLLFTQQSAAFRSAEYPAWVQDWLQRREQSAAARQNPARAVDEAAQVRRLASREKKVNGGLEALSLWLNDLLRSGLADFPAKASREARQMSARLIDAQCGGLAGVVQGLEQLDYSGTDWPAHLLDRLLLLQLATRAWQLRGALPEGLEPDLRSFIGFGQSKDEALAGQRLIDHWQIGARTEEIGETMLTEQYWLYGKQSRQYALVLNFRIPGQTSAAMPLLPGTEIEAELAFYPAAFPWRALVHSISNTRPFSSLEGFSGWSDVFDFRAGLLARQPWLRQFPAFIRRVTPLLEGGDCWLVDEQGYGYPVRATEQQLWQCLALSGGRPIDVFVLLGEKGAEIKGGWK